MVWSKQTRRESERILSKIPPISWDPYESLFLEESRFDGLLDPGAYGVVPDPEDRKFAALADATGSILIPQDVDLLGQSACLPIVILTPAEFLARDPFQRRVSPPYASAGT